MKTPWFNVDVGLKLCCLLSTTMFNLYLNDLSDVLRHSGKGIISGNDIISHLLYADDLVLLAETESDLQILLDVLSNWCILNKMNINPNKTKVMHFRNKSVARTDFQFKCGNSNLEFVEKYKYLGLYLQENLDYSVTVKYVAQSATRALGLLISKFKGVL